VFSDRETFGLFRKSTIAQQPSIGKAQSMDAGPSLSAAIRTARSVMRIAVAPIGLAIKRGFGTLAWRF
jgi:hypothetical protein